MLYTIDAKRYNECVAVLPPDTDGVAAALSAAFKPYGVRIVEKPLREIAMMKIVAGDFSDIEWLKANLNVAYLYRGYSRVPESLKHSLLMEYARERYWVLRGDDFVKVGHDTPLDKGVRHAVKLLLDHETDEPCPICLEPVGDALVNFFSCCMKPVHSHCMVELRTAELERGSGVFTCPMCRAETSVFRRVGV